MEKLVTVIVPVAQAHVGLLPKALSTLTTQSIQTHQVIVVNDSGKSLRCNDGAKVINTQGHQGAAVARNLGIEHADTPFLLFLDADDLLSSTAIETMVRAYAAYDGANYLYGDSLHVSHFGEHYYAAPVYDQQMFLTRNVHAVTTLLPTESVKAVGGFDEKIQGWEDWEFYTRLAMNGYCGAKVPVVMIAYAVELGVSREKHRRVQEEILADRHAIYGAYIEGKVKPMGCCGSNAKAKAAAQALVEGLPPDVPVDGYVMMEYIGIRTGKLPFRVGDVTYYGANNDTNRFVRVKAEHAPNLERTRVWRQVPSSAMRAKLPTQSQPAPAPSEAPLATAPIQARRQEPPAIPQQEAIKPCVHCGHLRLFHAVNGCEALLANGACGCKEFKAESAPEAEAAQPKPRRRAKVAA